MLPIAMTASVFILWLAWREGWTRQWFGRVATGLLCYALLLIAFPPPVPQDYQILSLVAPLAVGAVMMLVAWITGSKPVHHGPRVGQPMMSEILFEEIDDDENDEDDTIYGWSMQPVDDVGMREPQRNQDSGSASEVGSSQVRLASGGSESAGAGSASSGASSGSASQSGRVGGSSERTSTSVNGARTGKNRTGNGMVAGVAVSAAYRGGRGRRLSGDLVQGQSAPGHGDGSGYDAHGTAVTATITSASAQSGA